jgi:hypothetical protein
MQFKTPHGSGQKPVLRIIQAVLLFLILIGIILLITRDKWVPEVVEYIMRNDATASDEAIEMPEGWKIASTQRLVFTYPADFGTTYIQPQDWPPDLMFLDEAFSCTEGGGIGERAGRTELRTINTKPFCVTTVVGAAAGSTYTQYAYAFSLGEKTAILTFTTRAPQCANYAGGEAAACTAEKNAFKLDELVDQMARTVTPSPE